MILSGQLGRLLRLGCKHLLDLAVRLGQLLRILLDLYYQLRLYIQSYQLLRLGLLGLEPKELYLFLLL
jgi:hypothetical protein